jgi:hypothetical protein
MMDRFDAMRIFVGVAERASFTQAADSLRLSKAAVSGGVRYLEELVGVRLFHRTTRSVQLTAGPCTSAAPACFRILKNLKPCFNIKAMPFKVVCGSTCQHGWRAI